jgi:hypothetical protein
MASSSATVERTPTYIGMQETEGLLRCLVPGDALSSYAVVLATGTAVSATWGAAAVLAAGVTNTFGAAELGVAADYTGYRG